MPWLVIRTDAHGTQYVAAVCDSSYSGVKTKLHFEEQQHRQTYEVLHRDGLFIVGDVFTP